MKKWRKIPWDERAGAAANARRHLPAMVLEYYERGRKLLAGRPEPADLHPLRLATKRLRYTLELFRPCYGQGLGSRIAALQQLQQLLGEVNDTVAASRALAENWKGRSSQRAHLEKLLRNRGTARTRGFHKHWIQTFDAPGQERWWSGYLARNSRPPGRKRA